MTHASYPVGFLLVSSLLVGLFLPVHTQAQTQQGCVDAAEKIYFICMEEAVRNIPFQGLSPDEEPRCANKRNISLESCLSQLELESDKGKVGCYCRVERVNDNLASEEVVLPFPEKNTREKCVVGEAIQSGDTPVSCKWHAPPTGGGNNLIQLPSGISSLNKLGLSDPGQLIGRVIKAAMGVIGTIALTMLVYAGILFMTAAGNSDREKKAMDIMFWSGLGIVVVLSSYAIVQFIVENAFTP